MIKILSLLFLLFAIYTHTENKQQESKLKTGWYYINTESVGVRRQLDKSGEIYFINPLPIIISKNIKTIFFRNDKNGTPYLEMRFDSIGTNAWRIATKKAIGKKLGFIFNDKLIQVPTVNSEIDFGVAAIWDYSKSELELIKNSIENKKLN